MSRSADAPPVRMPTRMRFEREVEEVTIRRAPWVLPRVLPRLGVLARSKRIPALARSVALSFGGAPRLSLARTQLAASPAAIAMSPLPHQFAFWNEIDVDPLSNVPLATLHQVLHVHGARIPNVDDEVRVLRAHHRAADGRAFQPGGLDQATRVIARRIAKDRSGIRLRERLFPDALVRDLSA